jgi:hypothetical protein
MLTNASFQEVKVEEKVPVYRPMSNPNISRIGRNQANAFSHLQGTGNNRKSAKVTDIKDLAPKLIKQKERI